MPTLDTVLLFALVAVTGGILVALKTGMNQILAALQAIHDARTNGRG